MSIFVFLIIGGLILKGLFILIELSIDNMSLKYDTKISLPINVEHEDFTSEMEMEASSNSLKPLGKQIYMHIENSKTSSA